MEKNKRAFLLAEETLKIILSVIAIAILVYLLYSLYQSNKESKDLEFAKSSLNYIFQSIDVRSKQIQIYNPESWYVESWPNSYEKGFLFFKSTINNGSPLSCSNLGWKSCLCICDGTTPDDCDSKGICLGNKDGYVLKDKVQIENPPIILKINYDTKQISK